MKQHFFPQTAAVKMGIDFRRADLLMAQHGLYRPQSGPSLQQMRGKTVPERVRRYLFPDAGRLCVVLDENKERNPGKRPSATHGQEHHVLKTLHRLHLPPYGEPVLQLLHRTSRNGHQTLLTSLSEDTDVTFFQKQVCKRKCTQLGDAQATAVKHLDDATVAHALGRRLIYHPLNAVNLLHAEHLRQMHSELGPFKQFCRILFYLLFQKQIRIKAPHSGEHPLLSRGRNARLP